MENKKIKVYIYTRVSTAMQIDGYSLDAQRTRMRAFAEFNDYEVAGEYEDAGKSGKSIEGRDEAMPYYSSSPINMLPLVSYYIFLNKKCLFVVLQSRKMLPTGRIQRNLRFVAGDPKGDGVPLWHTTLPAKSSVLYLYPKAGSETAACAPLKHRLL